MVSAGTIFYNLSSIPMYCTSLSRDRSKGRRPLGLVLGISWPRSSTFNLTNQVPELLFNSLVYLMTRYHGYTGTNRSQCKGLDKYGLGIPVKSYS